MTPDERLIDRLVRYAYEGWPRAMVRDRRKLRNELKELRAEDPASFDRTFLTFLSRSSREPAT